ncbi:hypothetical protein IH922_06385 [candidate division KSB1 bacterium]|nr:hypothetical protein [candidate division KSB1 bacterium]
MHGIAYFMIGGLRYSVLFGKAWLAAIGKTEEEVRNEGGAPVALIELLRRSILDVSFSYAEHAERVNELMVKYADVPMSFADGCLVCMTEQTESTIFTLDSDFRIYRRRRNQPLQLIAPF